MPATVEPPVESPSFESAYRCHADRVYRFCLSRVRDPYDAQDLTADVFMAALAAYDRVRPDPAGVLPWLIRIARNATIDHHRKVTRRTAVTRRYLYGEVARGEHAEVERLVLAREDLHALVTALRGLSPRDRSLILRRYATEAGYREIASELGISAHGAAVATGRAVTRLRLRLAKP